MIGEISDMDLPSLTDGYKEMLRTTVDDLAGCGMIDDCCCFVNEFGFSRSVWTDRVRFEQSASSTGMQNHNAFAGLLFSARSHVPGVANGAHSNGTMS